MTAKNGDDGSDNEDPARDAEANEMLQQLMLDDTNDGAVHEVYCSMCPLIRDVLLSVHVLID